MHAICIKLALVSAALLSSATPVFAQGSDRFILTGSVVGGGGGLSTGVAYSILGTIGQPIAGGPWTNGPYSLTGGFWSGVVQPPDAPRFSGLKVEAGKVVLSWPARFGNYKLQTTTHLDDPNSWTDWKDPVVVVGNESIATALPLLRPANFFRLIRSEP